MEKLMEMMYELLRVGKPVAFYPYTSCVTYSDDNLELDYGHYAVETHAMYSVMAQACVTAFKAAGIVATTKWGPGKARVEVDNKIVFEWELYGKKLFVGFYDWRVSIGTKMRSDHKRQA
jgi:hypothetical protein